MTILVIGDLVTDVLALFAAPLAVGSDTAATIRVGCGGSAANTAAWLAYAGAPVSLVAVVGDDAAGTDRVAELAAAGVDCAVRRTPDAATGTMVVLSDGAERTMLGDRGANALLAAADVDAAGLRLPEITHVHLSAYPLFTAAGVPAARAAVELGLRRGALVSVDASSAAPLRRLGAEAFTDLVRGAHLLLANADEATVLAGTDGSATDQAGRLTSRWPVAVVKRGAAGAVWADAGGHVVSMPARQAPLVDPTGAGDAFAAGLLAALHRAHPRPGDAEPEGLLAAATALAAEAVSRVGARPPRRRR
jgi:sugar/nucleoside kinase (ribokinase family)